MLPKIIYLMGAGRSGTTALATFLGNSKYVLTVGEMHQFFEHIESNKSCSCGKNLVECEFWSKVLANLPEDFVKNASYYKDFCYKFEYHTAIFKYLFNLFSEKELKKYVYINETIFKAIPTDKTYILDSAKYIGRYLGLKRTNLEVKGIYVIRDVRGVINSFSKNVQTPRKPLSAIIYWLIINVIGEIVYRFNKKNFIKIKYEDFINNPVKELEKIEKFLKVDLSDIKEKIVSDKSFFMPHIIGGNRIRKNKKIKFIKDIVWRKKFSKSKQIFYYMLVFPLMILNRFKI